MNIGVQISVQVPAFYYFRYTPRSWITESCSNSMFSFSEKQPCCFPHLFNFSIYLPISGFFLSSWRSKWVFAIIFLWPGDLIVQVCWRQGLSAFLSLIILALIFEDFHWARLAEFSPFISLNMSFHVFWFL